MKSNRHCGPCLCLFVALGACQMQPGRDLGDTSTDERTQPVVMIPPAEPLGTPLSAFTGRWVGSAEDPLADGGERSTYVFPSGATAIELNIPVPEVGSRGLIGTIVFGAGSPPSPPTDPDRGYPPDVSYVRLASFNPFPDGPASYVGPLPPYEGFAYTLTDALYQSELGATGIAEGVLRMSYDTQEVLEPWCAMQEPAPDAFGNYQCAGYDNSYYEDGECSVETNNLAELLSGLSDAEIQVLTAEEWQAIEARVVREVAPIDCNKLFLCSTGRCRCDEVSCHADVSNFTGNATVRPTSYSYAELTLRQTVDGQGLIGIFNNGVFANERQVGVPVGVVHFERAD